MLIRLDSRSKKTGFLCIAAAFSLAFVTMAGCEFLASHYAGKADLVSLRRAIRFSPGNSDYHVMLARYLLATASDPRGASDEYRIATQLNPHDAQAWFELAGSAQVLDDIATQGFALQQAVAMDPTTPELAWQAGSFFLVQGDTDKALQEFRVVVANEPSLRMQALDLATHGASVDEVIRRVLPSQSDAYLDFLVLLMSRKDSEGATKVWSAMTKLGQRLEQRKALAY